MNGTTNTVDLSDKGVDNILAALADAGIEVHYNETDGDCYIDIWLTDFDAEPIDILSWRDSRGWWLAEWDTNDTNGTPDREWTVLGATPADVASDVAKILGTSKESAETSEPSGEQLPNPLGFALDEVLATVNGVDPIERDAEYEDCSAEELHIHKQLGRIRALISQIRTEVTR